MEIIHDSRQDGLETINSEQERRTFRKNSHLPFNSQRTTPKLKTL